MLDLVGQVLAGVIGLLLIVNLFRLLAGVRFSHWRHILSAYLAGLLFVILASRAQGLDGGAYLHAVPFAVAIEWMLLRRTESNARAAGSQQSS